MGCCCAGQRCSFPVIHLRRDLYLCAFCLGSLHYPCAIASLSSREPPTNLCCSLQSCKDKLSNLGEDDPVVKIVDASLPDENLPVVTLDGIMFRVLMLDGSSFKPALSKSQLCNVPHSTRKECISPFFSGHRKHTQWWIM
jgi:hypothetical protein